MQRKTKGEDLSCADSGSTHHCLVGFLMKQSTSHPTLAIPTHWGSPTVENAEARTLIWCSLQARWGMFSLSSSVTQQTNNPFSSGHLFLPTVNHKATTQHYFVTYLGVHGKFDLLSLTECIRYVNLKWGINIQVHRYRSQLKDSFWLLVSTSL